MADTLNFSWTYPTVGADLDTWGGVLNQAFIDIDADVWAIKGTADAALPKAGGTMTGKITLDGLPTADLHAATKSYVDTADALLLPKAGGTMTGTLVAKKAYTPVVVDSVSGASVTINLNDSNVFRVSMTGSVSTLTLQSPSDGQTINIRFKQTTGGHTMNWPTNFRWAFGSAPALSTAPGAIDLLVATYFADGDEWYASLTKALA